MKMPVNISASCRKQFPITVDSTCDHLPRHVRKARTQDVAYVKLLNYTRSPVRIAQPCSVPWATEFKYLVRYCHWYVTALKKPKKDRKSKSKKFQDRRRRSETKFSYRLHIYSYVSKLGKCVIALRKYRTVNHTSRVSCRFQNSSRLQYLFVL